jgi:hypothetical protein
MTDTAQANKEKPLFYTNETDAFRHNGLQRFGQFSLSHIMLVHSNSWMDKNNNMEKHSRKSQKCKHWVHVNNRLDHRSTYPNDLDQFLHIH